jgi:hypothetical protein
VDGEVCEPVKAEFLAVKISWPFNRMDKYFQVLLWLVMATLVLAIARQLSEQQWFHEIAFNMGWESFENPDDLEDDESMEERTFYEKPDEKQNKEVGNYEQTTNNYIHDPVH